VERRKGRLAKKDHNRIPKDYGPSDDFERQKKQAMGMMTLNEQNRRDFKGFLERSAMCVRRPRQRPTTL